MKHTVTGYITGEKGFNVCQEKRMTQVHRCYEAVRWESRADMQTALGDEAEARRFDSQLRLLLAPR